ncbi:MAG: hypothetical protein GX998_04415 [Firmicutes bacterium]|nr:hypothetical protein [Bacillota bacterium]
MKRNAALSVVLVFLLLGSFAHTAWARELARAELKVRLEIPVMQRLTVLQPAEIVFTYPANGQALVFTNVGKVRVQSNANWALTVGAISDSNVAISIRPSHDRFAPWQTIDGYGRVYTGPNGSEDISWDVKIESRRSADAVGQGMVQLYFTLGHL